MRLKCWKKAAGMLTAIYITAVLSVLFAGITTMAGCSQSKGNKEYDYIVSKDGKGDFKTIQQAIDKVPMNNTKRVKIFIKNGVYDDGQVFVDHFKPNISLIGESREGVKVTRNMSVAEAQGISMSAAIHAKGEGFTAENITFENTSNMGLAMYLAADKAVIKNCNIQGAKDALFLSTSSLYTKYGWQSRQYFENCLIKGTDEVIFGTATTVFNKCEIFNHSNNGSIVVPMTPREGKMGFVFIECALKSDTAANTAFLGRQGTTEAAAAFINCNMGEHVRAEGWATTKDTDFEKARFLEYKSQGPGAASGDRRKQINPDEIGKYSIETVLAGEDNWNPLKGE